MKLDHISYVTTREQLATTVQRLGSLLGSTFRDGGVHPSFGTRNFTAPLKSEQYFEIVCPLEHPATETSHWGKAVLKKAKNGGGWLTWVFSTHDISRFENKFGRPAIHGHRLRPDGYELRWKQIGVLEISEAPELPFFVEWLSSEHPAKEDDPTARIKKIKISDNNKLNRSSFKNEILQSLGEIEIEWENESPINLDKGISSIEFLTPNGIVSVE